MDETQSMKCLLVTLMVLGLSVNPTWSTCSAPMTIRSGSVQVLPPNTKPNPVTGKYPENAEAKVDCNPGFQPSSSEAQYLTCSNGEWKQNVKADESICVPIHCGRPPSIEHGYYTNEKTRFKLSDKTEETYAFGTILMPACEMHYTINCTVYCGRIACSADGTWHPRDGTVITQCVAQALIRTTNSATSHEDRGETGLKHYLIIVLAVVCILIVGALTVILLRRPAFCKKHSGRSSSRSTTTGGAGNSYNPNMLRNCEEPSISPVPAPLDSLPVAMNTGIFVPGGSYDWQECRFQEATLTGTSVFK